MYVCMYVINNVISYRLKQRDFNISDRAYISSEDSVDT